MGASVVTSCAGTCHVDLTWALLAAKVGVLEGVRFGDCHWLSVEVWDRDLGSLPVDDCLGAAVLPLAPLLAPLIARSGGSGGARWSDVLALPVGRTEKQRGATGAIWLQVT